MSERKILCATGDFGKALTEAIGLSGRRVRSIKIEAEAMKPVIITAEIMDIDADTLTTVLCQYMQPAEAIEEIVKEEQLTGENVTSVGAVVQEHRCA